MRRRLAEMGDVLKCSSDGGRLAPVSPLAAHACVSPSSPLSSLCCIDGATGSSHELSHALLLRLVMVAHLAAVRVRPAATGPWTTGIANWQAARSGRVAVHAPSFYERDTPHDRPPHHVYFQAHIVYSTGFTAHHCKYSLHSFLYDTVDFFLQL